MLYKKVKCEKVCSGPDEYNKACPTCDNGMVEQAVSCGTCGHGLVQFGYVSCKISGINGVKANGYFGCDDWVGK